MRGLLRGLLRLVLSRMYVKTGHSESRGLLRLAFSCMFVKDGPSEKRVLRNDSLPAAFVLSFLLNKKYTTPNTEMHLQEPIR